MICNADCTLYNRIYDPETRGDRWQRAVLRDVNWQDVARVRVTDKGAQCADSTQVFVPFRAGYAPPKEFGRDPAERWTLRTGDILVRGIVEYEMGTPGELQNLYDDVRTIAGVSRCDVGSAGMQHWEVDAV